MKVISYEAHPVSELFPVMDDDAYAALKADIAAHGQAEPIVLWKKQLIDGRHRLQACKELGMKPVVVDISDSEDPLAYVISHNLHRRHLSTSQRAMVAAKIATMKVGDNQHAKKEGPQICGPSAKEAAAALNVSARSVETARQVLEHGAKAVQKAVEQGDLAISTAAELATSGATKAEQTQAVKGGKEAIKGVLKKPPSPAKPSEDWHPREMSAPIMAHCQTLTKIGNDIKKRAEQRGGEWIDMQSVAEQIKQLKHSLKLSMYYADCPHCKAKGCKRCRQSGFFPVLKKQQVDEDNGVKK